VFKNCILARRASAQEHHTRVCLGTQVYYQNVLVRMLLGVPGSEVKSDRTFPDTTFVVPQAIGVDYCHIVAPYVALAANFG
jgi:hypothetical protein